MKKAVGLSVVLGIFLTGALLPSLNADENSASYKSALAEATAMDRTIRATRANYTKMVVTKLKQEGAGASLGYEDTEGHVPLPAVFIRRIAFDLVRRERLKGSTQFSVALRSLWNLNDNQGLLDDFERDGWEFLVEQQEAQVAEGKSLKDLDWRPYLQLQTAGGQQVLRYMSADTAAAPACVSCHNAWEQNAEIKTKRRRSGIPEGKQFQRHELMGALSIAIPLQ